MTVFRKVRVEYIRCSQGQAASEIGMHVSRLSVIESGEVNPSFDKLVLIRNWILTKITNWNDAYFFDGIPEDFIAWKPED